MAIESTPESKKDLLERINVEIQMYEDEIKKRESRGEDVSHLRVSLESLREQAGKLK